MWDKLRPVVSHWREEQKVGVTWPAAWRLDRATSHLWDIRQLVRTLAKNIVKIRYQEMTNENIEEFMCAAVTVTFKMCEFGNSL
jgi:hypothetical protein